MCEQKENTVDSIKNGDIVISFRRWLPVELRGVWQKIWALVEAFQLSETSDKIIWKWDKKGKFTVKSIYNMLTEGDSGIYLRQIWKGKIPPKIKYFMWLLSNGVILTKDNMKKRNWNGNPECHFCDSIESNDHLFFQCPIARVVRGCVARCFGANDIPDSISHCWLWFDKWLPKGKKFHVYGTSAICWAIWKARHKACFENKIIKSPLEIICHAGALMKFWAGLYPELDKKELEKGVDLMLKVAMNILASKKSKSSAEDEEMQDNQDGGRL
jgi:hypothetical protein